MALKSNIWLVHGNIKKRFIKNLVLADWTKKCVCHGIKVYDIIVNNNIIDQGWLAQR